VFYTPPSPRTGWISPKGGAVPTVSEEVRRIDLLGQLAKLSKAQLIYILRWLQERGVIGEFNQNSSNKILAETIADRAREVGPQLQQLISKRMAPKPRIARDVLERLTGLIERDYSPADVNKLLGELEYYGILDRVPSGGTYERTSLLARVALEDLDLVKDRFPDLEQLVIRAKGESGVPSAKLQQALNYLLSLPISSIREALREVSGPSSPYRPGRTKETAARALLVRLTTIPANRINAHSPVIARAYNILKGSETFASPSRMGTPVKEVSPKIANFAPPMPRPYQPTQMPQQTYRAAQMSQQTYRAAQMSQQTYRAAQMPQQTYRAAQMPRPVLNTFRV
jgi:hypothetical protein